MIKHFLPAKLRPLILTVLMLVMVVSGTSPAGEDHTAHAEAPEAGSLSAQYDFFTNYGQYMPRIHCLRTASGEPDWPWIVALILLQLIVITGYVRIFLFWRHCFRDEVPDERDRKLMELAWLFALCALCGYGLSTIVFFWPIYRIQAILLAGLSFATWRFAFDMEPFRKSFASLRLQRQLMESAQREKETLEDKHRVLAEAHEQLARTTEELKRANQDLDEFVYAASHDLKAPLRAIDNLSQFVIEDLGEDISEQSHTDLLELKSRVQRMERMLSGLLDYSRTNRQSFSPEVFTLQDLLEQSVKILDVPSAFDVQLPDVDFTICSARPPLEQVIRNLVDNAIKHHDKPAGTVRISAVQTTGWLRITVVDDGPGIAEEYQRQVFDMFQTLKRRDEMDSSGMGLALVKRVVESNGGTISVESVAGEGAAFRVTWPTADMSEQIPDCSQSEHESEELINA